MLEIQEEMNIPVRLASLSTLSLSHTHTCKQTGAPNRRLLKEGVVDKVSSRDATATKKADLVLFTDALALHRSTRVALRDAVDMITFATTAITVVEVPYLTGISNLDASGKC